jgi:hypothetical protein
VKMRVKRLGSAVESTMIGLPLENCFFVITSGAQASGSAIAEL